MAPEFAWCSAQTKELRGGCSAALRLQRREGVTSWDTPVPNAEPPCRGGICAHYRLGATLLHLGFPEISPDTKILQTGLECAVRPRRRALWKWLHQPIRQRGGFRYSTSSMACASSRWTTSLKSTGRCLS